MTWYDISHHFPNNVAAIAPFTQWVDSSPAPFPVGHQFESLGRGSLVNHLIWLANVDSAVSASILARQGALSPSTIAHFETAQT